MPLKERHTLDMDRYPLQSLTVDGVRFTYREAGSTDGDKPAIVLLHGIGSGSGSWLYQFDDLAAFGYLLAWDAPGYGGSTPLGTEQPLAHDYASALKCFCDARGVTNMILIGHSLGAMMAARFAGDFPEMIDRLILVAPATGYANATREKRETVIAERNGMMERLGPEGLARMRSANLLAKDADAEKRALVRQNMSLLTPEGYCQAVHLLAHGDITADISRHTGPVDILCGGADTITPPDKVRNVAKAAADATYNEIPGAGHACYIDQPGAFAAHIRPVIAARFERTT